MNKVVLIAAAICLALAPGLARGEIVDLSADLKEAQKALAAGSYDRAFSEYFRVARTKSNPLAQFTVALFYRYGWGRPADPATACTWYGMAAQGSIPAAAHFYAECLEQGTGVPADSGAAARWYEKAASLGHVISLCSLGRLHIAGEGVPKDPARGLMLCQTAADSDIVPAQVQLGRFYLEGDPAIRDPARAVHWLSVAARRNSAEAAYLLGIMHRDGVGTLRVPEQAKAWFETAASQGYAAAYLPTAELYMATPSAVQTHQPAASDLAKAYLWLSAAQQRSATSQESARAAELLAQVRRIMPKSWEPSLDRKVAQHLADHPSPDVSRRTVR